MAGTKEIKRRIKSVKNTKKITKAMELVAASKMKRAVSSTLASRLYSEYSWEILTSIAENGEALKHPFFAGRTGEDATGKTLLLLVTSNRGLCGAYNAQVIKQAAKKVLALKNENAGEVEIITIGKKGDSAMRRLGQNIKASFFELPDNITLFDINAISKMVTSDYALGKYDKVLVAYTDFVSALTQKPNVRQLLPISKKVIHDLATDIKAMEKGSKEISPQKTNYLFEGDRDKFIGSLAEKLTKMQIYQMFLESNASEQSSRMMAMKNASEASSEMIDELTLIFNKARQSNITREISEISAGMASVE